MNEQKLFTKGFNQGYALEKVDPTLMEYISKGCTDLTHPYIEGFFSGRKEYNKEKVLEQRIEEVRNDMQQSKQPTKDKTQEI